MPRELVEVAPGVLVATSRTMSTTSTVVARGGDALLVDPAWHPDELAGLADAIDARGLRVVAGLATHAHHDHLLWHPRLGNVPRWASPPSAALAREQRAELREAVLAGEGSEDVRDPWTPELLDLVGRVDPFPAVGIRSAGSGGAETAERMPTAGVPGAPELVVHDAHAPGHAAVWLPESRVLLAGDMLSDLELPLPFAPDDLSAYLEGLDRLAPYVARARVVVPGHGRPTSDGLARLDADRRYLDALLAGRDPGDPRRANPGMADVHARLLELVGGRGE
ncbi:MBL fold metallo-hydrolase [Luteimicrobium sp. DT211]|uniref:MBL fold metallo-hydrolase n=1 Tax=Luteimicrobium sp. DT211 TaxID=3393412 RepID=UPI003CF9848A